MALHSLHPHELHSVTTAKSSRSRMKVARLARFARLWLCAGMLPFLLGCAGQRGENAVGRPSPSPTPEHTATPVASPTPWPADIAYPVAVDPDRVSADLLDWLDPSRAPRLDSWRFLRRENLLAVWPEEHLLFDDAGDAASPVDPAGLPPVVLAVVVSTDGLDLQPGEDPEAAQTSEDAPDASAQPPMPPSRCGPLPSTERERLFALFDPAGPRRASGLVEPGLADAFVQLAEVEEPEVEVAGERDAASVGGAEVELATELEADLEDGSEASTESETASAGAALTDGEPDAASSTTSIAPATAVATPKSPAQGAAIPARLQPAFSARPLLPGNRWTWRITERSQGLHWSAATLTETVEAVWILGDGLARVDSRIELAAITPRLPEDLAAGVLTRYMTPAGVFRDLDQARGEGAAALGLVDEAGEPRLGMPVEPALRPFAADAELGAVDVPDGEAGGLSLETPAGSFSGCREYSVAGGAAWGIRHWDCPKVGAVFAAMEACSASFGRQVVYELISVDLEREVATP